jgi:hypothetical protein
VNGAFLQLLGAVLLVASVFMPWLVLGVGLSISGDKLGSGGAVTSSSAVFIIVGCSVALVAAILVMNPNAPTFLGQIGIVACVLTAVFAVVRYQAVEHQVSAARTIVGSSANIGFGWWVCFVSILLILAGGLVCRPLNVASDRR